MLYGAPEVPGQEKEPVQRVAHFISIDKNVRNKMKKIRQTNFYTIIASEYPKM